GFGNVVVSGSAVGREPGQTRFFAQRERAYNRGNSSARRNPDLGDRFLAIEVPVVTLDGFFDAETRGRVAVIQIDTEGYEPEVLAGARELVREARPIVVFEFEARYHLEPRAVMEGLVALLPAYALGRLDPAGGEIVPFTPAEVSRRGFR